MFAFFKRRDERKQALAEVQYLRQCLADAEDKIARLRIEKDLYQTAYLGFAIKAMRVVNRHDNGGYEVRKIREEIEKTVKEVDATIR